MNNRQLKIFIHSQLSLETELIELIEGCFKELFKEDAGIMLHYFNENLQNFEDLGCINGIQFFVTTHKNILNGRKEIKDAQNI
jgi:hypothetical protein